MSAPGARREWQDEHDWERERPFEHDKDQLFISEGS